MGRRCWRGRSGANEGTRGPCTDELMTRRGESFDVSCEGTEAKDANGGMVDQQSGMIGQKNVFAPHEAALNLIHATSSSPLPVAGD